MAPKKGWGYYTCEWYQECGYTTDASDAAIATHLRKKHGLSSRNYMDMEDMVTVHMIAAIWEMVD